MAKTLVQFRADEELRLKAAVICNRLGLDLQSYLRMCLARLVDDNGIPFSVRLEPGKGLDVMGKLQKQAAESGLDGMSLSEINDEITGARKQMRGTL